MATIDAVPLQIEVGDLERWRQDAQTIAILDVREAWERDICAFDGSINIPLTELPERHAELPVDRPLVVVCHHGMRSLHATQWLRAQGHETACNLHGGVDAWASQIDPAMKRY
jgi:rhodanese-related sulfurtransferase